MTYKQIEASREIRLWIGQVIVPAAIALVAIDRMNPELKHLPKKKIEEMKVKRNLKKWRVIESD